MFARKTMMTQQDTSFVIGGASYDSISHSGSYDSPKSFNIDPTGTKIVINGREQSFARTLSTAFNISTITGSGSEWPYVYPEGGTVASDGDTIFWANDSSDRVEQQGVTTSWSVSGLAPTSPDYTKSISSETTDVSDVDFSNAGTTMYIVEDVNSVIYQYTVSTAHRCDTASYASKSFDSSAKVSVATAIRVSDDGSMFFVLEGTSGSAEIFQYSMSSGDISTGSFVSSLDCSTQLTGVASSFAVFPDEGKVYIMDDSGSFYQYST